MENLDLTLSVNKLIHTYEFPGNPDSLLHLLNENWTTEVRESVLSKLSDLLVNEACTIRVAELFSPLLLELLQRCASNANEGENIPKHEAICLALAKLIWIFPEAQKFSKLYFERSPHLLVRMEDGNAVEPPSKKQKADISASVPDSRVPDSKILETTLKFLMYDAAFFKEIWNWSLLALQLNHEDIQVRWYAYHCLAHVGNIRMSDLNTILRQKFGEEDFAALTVQDSDVFSHCNYNILNNPNVNETQEKDCLRFHNSDLSMEIANVSGVLLNRFLQDDEVTPERIVCVPTVEKSLKELALAVASGEPVLIQGPVGCGKTSLVEHMAELTGRKPFENLLKVQLGEHMDSKMLVGSHCCTEVPGEFLWHPGILTQAMTEGHWLLLEDIDCAPMDVISLLAPVLKSKTLMLPGHAEAVETANGFQIFATQRLLTGYEGTYLEFKSNADMIDKQWRKIRIEPLSREELKEVIYTKWPVLESAIDRILDVYYIFFHNSNAMDTQSIDTFSQATKQGRLISTRDLFKFCSRIAVNFDIKSPDVAVSVFQNAIECFCDSIADVNERMMVAEAIGIKFNIPISKVSYLIQVSKPEILIGDSVKVGRTYCHKKPKDFKMQHRSIAAQFAHTRQAASVLEKVAVAVSNKEPVLLVGETGTGKTSIVQHLANMTNNDLVIINMNQQSDSIDLVGGYKPVDLRFVISPVKELYEKIFPSTFSKKHNMKFLSHVTNCFYGRRYTDLCTIMLHTQKEAMRRLNESSSSDVKLQAQWRSLGEKLQQMKLQIQQSENPLAFKFIEGALVKAMKKGQWLLLDEINLAEAETLECLAGVLERDDNSLFLLEKGDKEPVIRNPDFRIFACMNPATDVGKKDLPVGIRNRFTEIFMEELSDKQDLMVLVHSYLQGLSLKENVIENIVNFYLNIKKEAVEKLSDGTGHHPHYSLRTLCRALSYAATNSCGSVPRSLYEAFCLSFLSQLDRSSHPFVKAAITSQILGTKRESVLKQQIPQPSGNRHENVMGYWIPSGNMEPDMPNSYIMTKTVEKNLHDLARIVSAARYPVLLQGETSVGKTSLVQYLAQITGNHCLRVNNHEHTDIQEYVGTYSADSKGKLSFKEGILVEAMRHGHWIILDELNLAPTDVMEALNRVLDDNRELFITETQETVKAHPKFMVFATQNPPGLYGGRKMLSRAFRNRFIELHFSEIPPAELEVILEKRCSLPPSYSKQLVGVMQELQIRRRESGVFAGKQGYITLRDLFRWGERYNHAQDSKTTFYDWSQHLADEGYMLLAGRVRRREESEVILEAIQKHLKRVVDPKHLFSEENPSPTTADIVSRCVGSSVLPAKFDNIVWTYNMRRLAVLVGQALKFSEPVLLIGETGCGKTTICQIFAESQEKQLHTVNCHMHSEGSDFLGGLRPVRDDENSSKFFEWVNGPLIKAMQKGDYFLADEISLADDSVLERLNSVLEPERTVLLAEKGFEVGSDDTVVIKAKQSFRFLATMNPGGDFGKKELSPALRNRFTEIWCPNDLDHSDLVSIVEHNIKPDIRLPYMSDKFSGYGEAIAGFLKYFLETDVGKRTTISIRDVLTWVDFINATEDNISPTQAYIHGAFLVFLDSLGSGTVMMNSVDEVRRMKEDLCSFLLNQVQEEDIESLDLFLPEYRENAIDSYAIKREVSEGGGVLGIGPFEIETGPMQIEDVNETYILDASTPKANAVRILRGMQLTKPILLEGNPGVGKTSLITALAKASGHQLVRINLSEQTDISDLFGADLPVEGGEKGRFAWRDGPFIQALKFGHWILLDELNLAPQSVLEGLNACLDHRNEIYIPEIGKTFFIEKYHSRIFGCQNPHKQGGSRKGLPRSFLNRFTQVYLQPLTAGDMEYIATSLYPSIPPNTVSNMVAFNDEISKEINEGNTWNPVGYPFDFNLRDVLRWCEAMLFNQDEEDYNPAEYIQLIYADRMRTLKDKEEVYNLYDNMFGRSIDVRHRPLDLNVFDTLVQIGYSALPRVGNNPVSGKPLCVLHAQLPVIESLMKCLEMRWMPILVGPVASGKSSVVQILSSLTGHPLRVMTVNSEMDTTELLGGFEQADITRQIDSTLQDLDTCIQHSICQCLQNGEEEALRLLYNLLYIMDKLKHVSSNQVSSSAVHEIKLCRQKVKCMLELVKIMTAMPITSDVRNVVESMEQVMIHLMGQLKSSDQVSSCGKFEWVDSALVQAVKKGHWLLIDNANFCSPSVLDRLNGLMEPNGVLTVTEQGVVGDDLLTIVPHPEFRMILTMDPRNGEISRAMRNRGLEIFVEPLNCGNQHSDKWDLSSLIHNQGISHTQVIKHFLRIHQKLMLTNNCETPSVYDLINAATLCTQMLQKHENLKSSILESCKTVYAENILNCAAKKDICAIIEKDVEGAPEILPDYKMFQCAVLNMVPTIQDYQQNSVLTSLKKHTLLLSYLMRHNMDNYIDCERACDPTITSQLLLPSPLIERLKSIMTNDWMTMTTIVIRMMYESISFRDYKLVSLWLENCLENLVVKENCSTDMMMPHLIGFVLEFKKKRLDEIMEGPAVAKLIDFLSKIVDSSCYGDVDKEEIPLDPKWNPHLYKKLMLYLKKTNNYVDIEEVEDEIIWATNKFKIKLYAAGKQFLNADYYQMVKNVPTKSFYKMSENFAEGKSSLEDLPYPWIPKVYSVISMFFDALSEKVMKHDYMSDEDYWTIRNSVNIFYQFTFACLENITGPIEAQNYRVKLYWKWFIKSSKTLLVDSSSFPTDMHQTIIDLTHELVDENFEKKMRNKMGKMIGYPTPYYDYKVASIINDISSIFQKTNLIPLLASHETKIEDLKMIVTNSSNWNEKLKDAAVKCLTTDVESKNECFDALSDVNLIKLQLRDSGLLGNQVDDDDDEIMEVCPIAADSSKISTKELVYRIQLLPLWDYFFTLSEIELISDVVHFLLRILNDESHGEDSMVVSSNVNNKFLMTVGVHYLGLEPLHMAQLQELRTVHFQETLMACYVSFSQHLRSGFLSREGLSSLHWSPNGEKRVSAAWGTEFLWYKQPSLLSCIYSALFSGSSSSMARLTTSLGDYQYKVAQVETIQKLLWTNFEKLADPSDSFRYRAASIITSCFDLLLYRLPIVCQLELSGEDYERRKRQELCQKIGSILDVFIVSNINVLALAEETLSLLQIQMAKPNRDMLEFQWYLGKSYVLVGILTYIVMLPREDVDPVPKLNIKLKMLEDQLKEARMEHSLRKWLNDALTGQDFETITSQHPYLNDLLTMCQESDSMLAMRKKNTYRPSEVKAYCDQFTIIQSKCKQFNSVASLAVLIDFIQRLEPPHQGSVEILTSQELTKWCNIAKSFAVSMCSDFPFYRDIVLPFVDGIEKAIMGVQMMLHSINKKMSAKTQSEEQSFNIIDFFSKCCSFPTQDLQRPLDIALLISDKLPSFTSFISQEENKENIARFSFKLIKSALLETINEIVLCNKGSTDDIQKSLFKTLELFQKSWEKQELERKEKMLKDEMFYEFKTQKHEKELSDEEALEERREMEFPSFEEHFAGFIQEDILSPKPKPPEPATTVGDLEQEDILEVWSFYATVMSIVSPLDPEMSDQESLQWVIKNIDSPDYSTPHQLRCDIMNAFIAEKGDLIDESLDKKVLGAHLLTGQNLLNFCSLKDCDSAPSKNFNIYHDSDPARVMSMYPLLSKLLSRLDFLLVEFPENPNLMQVHKIVNRILSFTVTDPLMKFLVGLELTLTAAQNWEQNSHKDVSLSAELQPITFKVIECRKLEFNCWRQCLDNVVRKQYLNVSKWWFHLISMYVRRQDSEQPIDTNSMVTTLQQFLEDSSVGEFPARLCMLHTILQCLQFMSNISGLKETKTVLFNICSYYNQFLPLVKEKISQIRLPIEKEVKNFIKVSRWKDSNYYSVKAAVEKSHRTIVKNIKAFEKALAARAKDVFILPSKKDVNNAETSPWVLEIQWKDFLLKDSERATEIKGLNFDGDFIVERLPKLYRKVKKQSKSIVNKFPFVDHVNTLNEFAGQILETLENLDPEGGTSTAKETRKMKNLLMQKKKQALANLFKQLKLIGLSYGQGIIYCDNIKGYEAFCAPTLNSSLFKICGNIGSKNVFNASIQDANHYFYKSIAQFSVLMKALESPSKDLVIDIIHKSRGFSGHLMELVIKQRMKLVKDTQTINRLGSYVQSMFSFSESQMEIGSKSLSMLPPHIFVLKSKTALCKLLVGTVSTLEQFKMILDCCPSSTSQSDVPKLFPDVPPQSYNAPPLAMANKNGELWLQIYQKCNKCIQDTKNVITDALNSIEDTEDFATWKNLSSIKSCFKRLQVISGEMVSIIQIAGTNGYSCFTSSISDLITMILDEVSNFNDDNAMVNEECQLKELDDDQKGGETAQILRCKRIVKEILLSVQETMQFCEEEAGKEQDEDEMSDGLFTTKYVRYLMSVKKNLRVNKVMKRVKAIMGDISDAQNEEVMSRDSNPSEFAETLVTMNKVLRLTVNMQPVLGQYLQLLKVYLAVNCGMHRTSCKLLSILLGTFNVVATKGFCLPPELQAEALKSGNDIFKDIEEGGLGEGEGMTDVSKDIKTEDQLEGTNLDEKQKKEEDGAQIPDEEHGIEMSDDFEGKAFDPDAVDLDDEEKYDEEEDVKTTKDEVGEVDNEESETLNEKMWGSDSEDEDEDLREDREESGVPQKQSFQLGAKDDRHEDCDKEQRQQDDILKELAAETNEEEYDGEHKDPLIDAPPALEPEAMELPEDMQIDDIDHEEVTETSEEVDQKDDTMEDDSKDSDAEEKEEEFVDLDEDEEMLAEKKKEEERETPETTGNERSELADEEKETEVGEPDNKEDDALPTQTPTAEPQAMSTQDSRTKSSHDPIEAQDTEMEWEGGAKDTDEQHQEGQADADISQTQDAGHDGKKSNTPITRPRSPPQQKKQTFKPPAEDRTIDNSEASKPKWRPTVDHSSKMDSSTGDRDEDAEAYEHTKDEDMEGMQAVDIATEQQAALKPVQIPQPDEKADDDDDDVIQLDSSSEEEEEVNSRRPGDRARTDVKKGTNVGEHDGLNHETENLDGEIVKTQTVHRGPESTIHTQHDLWSAMSSASVHDLRSRAEAHLDLWSRVGKDNACVPDELWRNCETIVSQLAQELCEQLRLVLEPTKMSKLKGDYRTGKRLNMRKIIPYIASQFRKDKIWLRRTKPSKRQYQIMLAVDDSSSMADNHSKQLAFESMAVLGKSLSLLEAGELSVVRFGESVELLLSFHEPFTSSTGARVMQQFTFTQKKTNFAQLVRYATDAMIKSRISQSKLMSKETAQLLVIISDGRGVNNEGEEVIRKAVRRARDNNIFMVFLVMDSPLNENSILDHKCVSFDSKGLTEMKSYMEHFPFPFYILLRDISSLPQVLGEALRQWFELVTSAER